MLAAPEARSEARPSRARVELGGGLAWIGGHPAGAATATLTENPGGGRFTLFDTATRVEQATGYALRLAARVAGPIVLEGGFQRTHPAIETTVTRDAEGSGATLTGRLSRSVLEGSLRLDVEPLGFLSRRVVPFVLAGGGRLAEAEQGHEQIGHAFHAGMGLQGRVLSTRGVLRGIGLRVEGRLSWRSGGFDLVDDKRRSVGGVGASLCLFF
jgi:hypothetical protein